MTSVLEQGADAGAGCQAAPAAPSSGQGEREIREYIPWMLLGGRGGDTNSAEDTDGINYSVSISISATCLTRLSISCRFSMGQALVSFRRISSVFAETGEKCVNLSLHLEFGLIVREQSLVN